MSQTQKKDQTRIVIIGGVAGGASAAARARRLDETAKIVMFERGAHISFANCGLPYHISGEIADRERLLVQTPATMRSRFNIDVRINSEVMRIDRKNKEVVVKESTSNREYRESYDKLVLSPGAEAIRPPIPGIDSKGIYSLRNMEDMDRILAHLDGATVRRAVVVGGGFIGLEVTEALVHRELDVSLVERASQVLAPLDPEMATLLHQTLRQKGVKLQLETAVAEFVPKQGQLDVILDHGDSLLADIVIMAIGVKPETRLARDADLQLGETGGIAVNDRMQTSDTDIYAVGDVVETTDFVTQKRVLVPLAGPANRQGRIAADNILGRDTVYRHTQGTSICKVFDYAAGTTGANEKALSQTDIPYEKIYLHAASHAGYYPGAVPISLKLLFRNDNGKILGAQAVGASGVDKRMDVLATAIRFGMTVHDIQDSELSYAPPFGSAKDPVNYAGFVASNVIEGDMPVCHTEDMRDVATGRMLLDVRTPEEYELGTINNAKNIPVDQLRGRLAELPKDKEILVFCKVGIRGYLACRILTQKGYRCRNYSGGYQTWTLFAEHGRLADPKIVEVKNDYGDTPRADRLRVKVTHNVDACGLQCPGPILQLKSGMDTIGVGEALRISATDPGFATDAPAWCHTTGHELVELSSERGVYTATVKRKDVEFKSASRLAHNGPKEMSIVVFSGDLDKAMAAFIIANGAASMGYRPTLFFTFWGLNILRRGEKVKVKKTFMERTFGKMMPRGANKLALSKMNMAGMGAAMVKGIMETKQVPSLPEMIDTAVKQNVKLVACAMSMDLLGVKTEELVDGVTEGGVASYIDAAGAGNLNLFI